MTAHLLRIYDVIRVSRTLRDKQFSFRKSRTLYLITLRVLVMHAFVQLKDLKRETVYKTTIYLPYKVTSPIVNVVSVSDLTFSRQKLPSGLCRQ